MPGILFESLVLRDVSGNRPAAGIAGRLFFDTTTSTLQRDNGSIWEDIEGAGSPPESSAIYPDRDIAWAPEFAVVAGTGTATIDYSSSQVFYCLFKLTNPVNGGALECSMLLKAGTYTFGMLGAKTADAAKVDYSLDGVNFLTQQNWYNSSPVYNFIFGGSMVVASSGRHVIRMTANGKQSQSSGYNISYTMMYCKPSSFTSET